MRTKSISISVVLIFLSSSLAHAEICKPDGTPAQQAVCAVEAHKDADKALVVAYREKMNGLPTADQKALRLDERKWLKQADDDCKAQAKDEAKGGSRWSVVFHQCMAERARERADEFSVQ